MHETLEGAEAVFVLGVQWLRLVAEAAGAIWLAVGTIYALAALVVGHIRRQPASFGPIRLRFSRYLSLALEFQLAADILSTAIAPTMDELLRLMITAVVRTGLNYFLSKEIEGELAAREREARVIDHAQGVVREAG